MGNFGDCHRRCCVWCTVFSRFQHPLFNRNSAFSSLSWAFHASMHLYFFLSLTIGLCKSTKSTKWTFVKFASSPRKRSSWFCRFLCFTGVCQWLPPLKHTSTLHGRRRGFASLVWEKGWWTMVNNGEHTSTQWEWSIPTQNTANASWGWTWSGKALCFRQTLPAHKKDSSIIFNYIPFEYTKIIYYIIPPVYIHMHTCFYR